MAVVRPGCSSWAVRAAPAAAKAGQRGPSVGVPPRVQWAECQLLGVVEGVEVVQLTKRVEVQGTEPPMMPGCVQTTDNWLLEQSKLFFFIG
jgi:hypothetical protein